MLLVCAVGSTCAVGIVRARPLIGGWGMEEMLSLVGAALGLVCKAGVQVVGFLLVASLVLAWCLMVLCVTGRPPWFVRKYF